MASSGWVSAIIVLGALTACGSGDRSSRAVERDSAGIRIVENTPTDWPEGMGWRLGATPVLQIGMLDGPPEYQLFRATGSARLSDGRIVVANTGTQELRWYGPDGEFLFDAGGEGGGPGEFEGMSSLWVLPGDSVMVTDWRHNRASVFDPAGTFARSFQISQAADGSPNFVIGRFDDGTLLIRSGRMFMSGQVKGGVSRDSATYLRYDAAGQPLDTVARLPGPEYLVIAEENRMAVTSLAMGRQPAAVVAGDAFHYGSADTYEIATYDPDGSLARLLRLDHTNLVVTDQDIARYKEDRLADVDERFRSMTEKMMAETPFPETMPAHGPLQVDAEGNLWVAAYRRPGDDQPRWTVFDPAGRILGEVATPPRFTVHEIGVEYMLGRWQDDLDVEHVLLYDLIKPGDERAVAAAGVGKGGEAGSP